MGGHGHAIGAPLLGLGGMAKQKDAVGKEAWAPQHAGFLRSNTSNAQARVGQRTDGCKAAHRRA